MQLPQLEDIRIASPCPAQWDEMVGDDRTRFCEMCELHVHNTAGMTRHEAETMIRDFDVDSQGTGRLCVRMFRRADGTIITRDCPVGLRAVRQRVGRTAVRVAALVLFTISAAWAAKNYRNDSDNNGGNTQPVRMTELQPFSTIRSWLRGKPQLIVPPLRIPPRFNRQSSPPECLMGGISIERANPATDSPFATSGTE